MTSASHSANYRINTDAPAALGALYPPGDS